MPPVPPAPPAPVRRWAGAAGFIAVLPVSVLAVVSLWFPESPDQALFDLAAKELRSGGVYYQDLWDIKQPGLYWFYELGDVLGPGGIGARLLEALLAVVAAVLVVRITASWNLRRSVRLAAPTLVLGPYLAYSVRSGVGEIEGLMNVLLLAVVACTWPRERHSLRAGSGERPDGLAAESLTERPTAVKAWFAAGLVVGAVVLLKTFYLPIPVVILAGAALASYRLDRRGTLVRCGAAIAGTALPVAAAVIYFAVHQLLGVALWTTFVVPFQVAGVPDLHAVSALPAIAQAAKNMFAVIGPLAVIGLIMARRRTQGLLFGTLALTGLVALALALPQLWTAYRWLMLAAPAGLLAIGGLEVVLAWFARLRIRTLALVLRTAALVVVTGLTVLLLRPVISMATTPGQSWSLSAAARIARGENTDPVTHPVASAALVQGMVPPGSRVYVIGDARIQVLLGARNAAPVSGLTMHLMPSVVWNELAAELASARPAFVYVGSWDREAVTSTGSGRAVWALMKQHYVKIASTADGAWYQTADPGTGVPTGYQLFASR